MTPGARVAAAIEVMDAILDGVAAEKALSGWGRSHRFAGSKDRRAIRDLVFDALRCRASYGWRGGAMTGRAVMLGAMRAAGQHEEIFSGVGHAPPPISPEEVARPLDEAPRDVRFDMPHWLLVHFDKAFGADADDVLERLQTRASVFLRVNTARARVEEAIASLAEDAIVAIPVESVKTALEVIENERAISQSAAYMGGLVELQDTSSQAAIARLSIAPGMRVLDFCAGGGGKALAMSALGADVTAHDIDPRRMRDLEPRAARAGVSVAIATMQDLENAPLFDLVLCDAPCSGSGTWRRTPGAKWDLTPDRLTELTQIQSDVLGKAAPLVRPGGVLAFATCSVFDVENSELIERFIDQSSGFTQTDMLQIAPHARGDGFFLSTLERRL